MKILLASLIFLNLVVPTFAEWPDRPIKIIIPSSPGNFVDVVARAIIPQLSTDLKQNIIIENVPGAASTIGTKKAIESLPDGYTWLVTNSTLLTTTFTMKNADYNVLEDLIPVTPLLSSSLVLITSFEKYKNSDEFIKAARNNKMTCSNVGYGNPTHLACLELQQKYGFTALTVPFKGTPEMIPEIMTGRIDFTFLPRGLIGSNANTTVSLFEDKQFDFWNGVWAPKGVDPIIVSKFEKAIRKVVDSKEFSERIKQWEATKLPAMSQTQFQIFIYQELLRYQKLVHDLKLVKQ
jgi:tripartite-type tricarboxylate transporter receptor subunit TctC